MGGKGGRVKGEARVRLRGADLTFELRIMRLKARGWRLGLGQEVKNPRLGQGPVWGSGVGLAVTSGDHGVWRPR